MQTLIGIVRQTRVQVKLKSIPVILSEIIIGQAIGHLKTAKIWKLRLILSTKLKKKSVSKKKKNGMIEHSKLTHDGTHKVSRLKNTLLE